MPRRARRRTYPGGGEQLPLAVQNERDDFDDGAIPLWSLYEMEVRAQDEVRFQGLLADMSGVPTFAGLFAAVITSFLVDGLKNLQPDPAQQSVYYHQQSVAMLAQISQQLASIAPQVSVPSTPPPPYPVFHPSSNDMAVNILWVAGLVCSLSAALFATHIQVWVRSYLRTIQQYDHPLERARFQQFFLDRTRSVQELASLTTGAIRYSVVLFFLGQSISIFEVNTAIGAVTTVLICCPLFLSVHFSWTQRNILGLGISLTTSSEALHKKETEELHRRKDRDVQAIQGLIDGIAIAKMEPLLLAIPDFFDTEWGRDVWREVFTQTHAADKIFQSVKYLLDTCDHPRHFKNKDARDRRKVACIEATSSLVRIIDYRLDGIEEIGKAAIKMLPGRFISSPPLSFIIRWTCLSLVDIRRTLRTNSLKASAEQAVYALARFRPDETGGEGAQRIDECLKAACECAEDLRRAFEPWTQDRTREQVEQILLTHGQQISELERIKSEADGLGDVDRQISVYRDAVDNASNDIFGHLGDYRLWEIYRDHMQLIYPGTGKQLQALTRLGLKLREVLDGQVAEGYKEVLKSLKSIDNDLVSLRQPNGSMKRQLWRLQDVSDGGGLGFSVEHFFLVLKQLLRRYYLDESNSVFYTGTFKMITSRWEESKESPGTHHVLLNIICDLIIPGRGIFSDYPFPESVTTMLLDVVRKMLQGYTGPDEHIRDAVREIESANPGEHILGGEKIGDANRIRVDRKELQRKALMVFP
ncbi:hypothetical protein EDB83DRAFT_2315567 [Lactarius deliciosus]|nr:hypothetical protein EDB83DRAFT_2315567 [Lactarius deliciosus]